VDARDFAQVPPAPDCSQQLAHSILPLPLVGRILYITFHISPSKELRVESSRVEPCWGQPADPLLIPLLYWAWGPTRPSHYYSCSSITLAPAASKSSCRPPFSLSLHLRLRPFFVAGGCRPEVTPMVLTSGPPFDNGFLLV
jgi:hypothetical protein